MATSKEKYGNVSNAVLDENKLDIVSKACQPCATKWDRIGLRLGLPKSSLEIIKDQQHSDPVKCLDEMLSRWLKKAELISGYPSPSWRVLCNAIHDAGENPALAERIAEEHKCSTSTGVTSVQTNKDGFQIFRKHYPKLEQLVSVSHNRLTIAAKLYGESLITDDDYDQVTDSASKSDKEKGTILAKAVRNTIKNDPQKLSKLIEVFKSVEAFQKLGKDLETDFYGQN